MKKVTFVLIALLFCCKISQGQFFREDFSQIQINGTYPDPYRWSDDVAGFPCNGGSWGISTDTNYSCGNGTNTFYGSFNYAGSSNGFAKMSHWCNEWISRLRLMTPALNFTGQNQVWVKFAHEFPGVSIASIGFLNSSGQYSLVGGISASPLTRIDSIDISAIAANTNNVRLYFDLDYYGPTPSTPWSAEESAWCVDDVIFYNPSCNIQAVVKSGTGSNYFCYGDSLLLERENPVGGTSFQWLLDNTTIPGATNATYYATTTGAYSCLITDTCGFVYSNNLLIDTVSPISPQATHSGGVDSVFCPGSSNGYLLVPNFKGAIYQWYLNGLPLAGEILRYMNFSPYGAGSYHAVVTHPCGVYNTDTLSFVTGTLPTAFITPGVPFPTCYPTPFMLIANDSAGLTYQWMINGLLSTTYLNDTLIIARRDSTTFKCLVKDSTGCGNLSNAISISSSSSPYISAIGPTSFCVGDSVLLSSTIDTSFTYQWLKNNIPITGATQTDYHAKSQGSYAVMANGSFCSATSNAIQVLTPCIRKRHNILRSIQPINGNENIYNVESLNTIKRISIYNLMGQMVYQAKANDTALNLNLQSLKQGVYVATVESENDIESIKLIVE